MTLPPPDLNRLLKRISARIDRAGTVTINRAKEAANFKTWPQEELFAGCERHQLNVVVRMGGRAFEFTRRAST